MLRDKDPSRVSETETLEAKGKKEEAMVVEEWVSKRLKD